MAKKCTHPKRNSRRIRALARREYNVMNYEDGNFNDSRGDRNSPATHETTLKIAKREVETLRRLTPRY